MTKKNIISSLKAYRKYSAKKRQGYLRDFTEKMVYRTTKTENPETTRTMVKKVLNRIH